MSSNNTPIPAEGSMELVPQFRADDDVATIASALLEQGLVVVHRGVEFADALTADGAFDQILDTTKASGGGELLSSFHQAHHCARDADARADLGPSLGRPYAGAVRRHHQEKLRLVPDTWGTRRRIGDRTRG